MNSTPILPRVCTWQILVLLLLAPPCAFGQVQKPIFLQHADSLEGKIVGGEEARELIGNVVITQENVRISCDRALQFIRMGKVQLSGSVVIRDDSTTLRAPRANYYRDDRRAEAFEDVRLEDGKVTLTAGYGEYLIDARRAYFHTRVVVRDSASLLVADTLTYFRATRRSLSRGNVRVHTAADRTTIYGGRLEHDPAAHSSRMTVDPLLVQIDTARDGRADTLQVRALLLEALRDSTQRLIATDSVRIVRSEMAAVAQYACFHTAGDSIELRTGPVLWYAETQINGDSVNLYLRRRKLERMAVMGNAFALSRSDSLRPDRIDQLTGDQIIMFFDGDGLRRTDVEGRAISVYHVNDDSLANGLNKTSGDRIVMLFEKGRARDITFFGGVEGQYLPENMVFNHESDYAIPGIRWRVDRPRPVPFVPFTLPGFH